MNLSRNIKIGLCFNYAPGKALTKFYRHLQTYGTFIEAVCTACSHSYFPPLYYCPQCLTVIEKWNELGPEAILISHVNNTKGERIGMFTFENSKAIFFHKILVDREFIKNEKMMPVVSQTKVLSEILKGFKP